MSSPALSVHTPRAAPRRRTLRRITAVLAGIIGVAAAVVLGASIGPCGAGLDETAAILLKPLGAPLALLGIDLPSTSAGTAAVVWSIRLPRVVLALMVGAGLAAAGLVMQGVFRNPLADPGITGVSSGAAVVAVTLIVTGTATPLTLPVGAFAGALAATLVVQVIAGLRGGGGATLLLVGIALNSLLGAIISASIANAPDSTDAQQAMFWLNGDFTAVTWHDVGIAAAPVLLGTALLQLVGGELNLFLLGDEQAAATGMRTVRTRQALLALAAVVVAGGVAVCGVIGFVGLVVPHLARLVLGPDHRSLMPVVTVVGGIFLVLADLVARNLLDPVILQTGTVTSLVGAPVLLALIFRRGER